ncbi:MAG: serine hydrolase [Pseudobacter sp.]|uniref:serine hydrolase n=1 Tax=Pseudobacter sp. TaxID=2045420 RepID=UPI003F81578E
MNLLQFTGKAICILGLLIVNSTALRAHNGKIAHARPLGKITIDGNLSDWPANTVKYNISTLSAARPTSKEDFSGYFQVGYRTEERALYLAFTITDNDFVEDTSASVAWNTQDCLELCLDATHLSFGSGVASFMYSQKLRNTNQSQYDPFAKAASWDLMKVAHVQNGNTRIYEWRIELGDQFAVGKSIGLDFNVFDKDANGNFTINGWGTGEMKYRNAKSLGDIILMPQAQPLATVSGNVKWDRPVKVRFPHAVMIRSVQQSKTWVAASIDSNGNYSATVPAGKYTVSFPEPYYYANDTLFATNHKPVSIQATANQQTHVPGFTLSGSPVPDLLPAKGILHDFNAASGKQLDDFIKIYQEYYGIPGVSLALIKDGKIVYYKTYGYKNAVTQEKVDSSTLFEAASITKPVFSFAVQRLAERGIIDLDKPLYEYLPYKDIEYDERYKLITGKHVLTHRTGFPNWRWMNKDNKLNIMFTPGTDYNYSGEGFEYLKMVVEKITGKKVEQVLKEEVIEPMGLYHTFFTGNDTLKRVVSNGHYDRLPTYDPLPDAPGMAWSMHTEAKIFTRFMQYMLDQKGLSAATYDSMFTKHSDFKFDPGDPQPRYPSYMGISLEIRETPYGKSFGHGGNNGDFRCQFEVYKDLKMGYIVFTNANTSYFMLDAMRKLLVEGKE